MANSIERQQGLTRFLVNFNLFFITKKQVNYYATES